MSLLDTLLATMKKVSAWATKNPEKAMDAVQKVECLYTGKKYEPNYQADRMLVLEQRLNQLQEKTEKQGKKLDALLLQMQAMDERIRKLKTWLTVTGIALAVAVVAALLAFVL